MSAQIDPLPQGQPVLPVIFGVSGLHLTLEEKAFFRDAKPLGFILFRRNIDHPEQLRGLTDSLHEIMGRRVPILIDQEGGRVQRMGAPHWDSYPAARELAADEGELAGVADDIALDLAAAGVSVNCAPVLDVAHKSTHESIGDRAFSHEPDEVAQCGMIVCDQFLAHSVLPVMKHLPGLGRADMDTHHELPHVGAASEELRHIDLKPFQILARNLGLAVWGMVGHAVYDVFDDRHPASCSAVLITEVIRREIGFDGFLLSDDLDMQALRSVGKIGARAQAALAAGCDAVLQCDGNLARMRDLAAHCPPMREPARQRFNRSLAAAKAYRAERATEDDAKDGEGNDDRSAIA